MCKILFHRYRASREKTSQIGGAVSHKINIKKVNIYYLKKIMTHEYKKVDLTYIKTAKNKLVFEQKVKGSQEKAFSFIEKSGPWEWAGILDMEWSEKPYNTNTTRTATLPSGRVEEQFLLWEQNKRQVFRIERSPIKILDVLVEDWEVKYITENESLITWTLYYEFRGWLKYFTPLLKIAIRTQSKKIFDAIPNAFEKLK